MGCMYTNLRPATIEQDLYDNTLFAVYLLLSFGAVYVICTYEAVILFSIVGVHQGQNYRREYLQAVLR